MDPVAEPLSPSLPLIWAHRGASAQRRENTIEAFDLAADLGADGVELDARLSADGVVVVHHDATLPIDGQWAGKHPGALVGDVAADELPEHVPTLAASLETLAARRLRVNVEIKCLPIEADFDPTYRVVDAVVAALAVWPTEVLERILVTSFDRDAIARVHQLDDRLATGQLDALIADRVEFVTRAAAAGNVAVNPWFGFVDDELVRVAHDLGLTVNPWTVDDPAQIDALIALGVDGIITNVPDIARARRGVQHPRP